MKTRPVFESFGAFVDFLNNSVNESEVKTYKDLISNLNNFLDADAIQGFQSARKAFDKAPTFQKHLKNSLDILSDNLTYFDDGIDSSMDDNRSPDLMQISEKTTTEIKKHVYAPLINGKVKVANINGSIANCNAANEIYDKEWIDINDLLTKMNLANIYEADNKPSSKEDKSEKWVTVEKSNKVAQSGSVGMQYISSVAAGITVGMMENGFGDKILPSFSFPSLSAEDSSKNPVKRTLILYGIGEIGYGAGGTIEDYFIKKDFIKEVIPGEVTEYEAKVDGSDGMFDQNGTVINPKQKDAMDKMLTAALAPLAASPESITIVGGASYESSGDKKGPDSEINKKLVVSRANAVKKHLETLYPELVGKVKVDDKDFSKIQKTDDAKEYPNFRKVYLKVRGVLQGDSKEITRPIDLVVNQPILADSVEIIQYAISIEYSLPKFKKPK
jgi:hypothetical protein